MLTPWPWAAGAEGDTKMSYLLTEEEYRALKAEADGAKAKLSDEQKNGLLAALVEVVTEQRLDDLGAQETSKKIFGIMRRFFK